MNIEKVEKQIIAYLEGELTVSQEQEILELVKSNADVRRLWDSYKEMYQMMESAPSEVPSDNLQMRFTNFLAAQEEAEPRKTISMIPWKRLTAVAASLALFFMFWSMNKQNRQMEETLVNVNNQLHQMMQEQSPTERIKTIRVNYSNDPQNNDQQMIQLLVDVLENDESSNVRLAAAETLGGYARHENVRSALIRALGVERDGSIKHTIVQILGRRIDDKIITTLEQIVNDDSQEKFVIDEAHMQLIRYGKVKS